VIKFLGDGHSADDIVSEYSELETENLCQATKYGAWLASEKLPSWMRLLPDMHVSSRRSVRFCALSVTTSCSFLVDASAPDQNIVVSHR
jgi:hypothetical protein